MGLIVMALVANFHSVEAISPFSIIPFKSKQKDETYLHSA
jgi:hypothetical protein